MASLLLREMFSELPRQLQDQIYSYSESVEEMLPQLFAEAHVSYSKERASEVIAMAGLKKFYALAGLGVWAIEKSSDLLARSDVWNIRIGGTDLSRGTETHQRMQTLKAEIEAAVFELGLSNLINENYVSIIQALSGSGHRGR